VVWFYDPGCGHCKEEGPKLAQVMKGYDSVALYTVSTDPAEGWTKALESWGFDRGTHVARVGVPPWYEDWDIFVTPKVFVLDADKRILSKQIDAATIGIVLDHALEELASETP
jgi:thiol-disulfide isomerase/thioredoxin